MKTQLHRCGFSYNQLVFGYGGFILIAAILFSCQTVSKARKILDKNPLDAAQYCGDKFPIKERIETKDSIRFDTLLIPSDTIYLQLPTDTVNWTMERPIYKVCPPSKIIKKTIIHDSTIYQKDSAGLRERDLIIYGNNQDIKRITSGRNTWRWIGMAEGLLILLIIALLIYRIKPKL
jgi:hypothetical protein